MHMMSLTDHLYCWKLTDVGPTDLYNWHDVFVGCLKISMCQVSIQHQSGMLISYCLPSSVLVQLFTLLSLVVICSAKT